MLFSQCSRQTNCLTQRKSTVFCLSFDTRRPNKHGRRLDHDGKWEKSPEFGVGDADANCPPDFVIDSRYKKECYVAFKIRQNPFSAGVLPRTPLGELTTLPRLPSRLGRKHPSHTLPHSTPFHFRRSPCVPQNSSQILIKSAIFH